MGVEVKYFFVRGDQVFVGAVLLNIEVGVLLRMVEVVIECL